MKRWLLLLGLALACGLAGAASARADNANARLLKLLQAKGVIGDADIVRLAAADEPGRALVELLAGKGVLSRDEASELLRPAWAEGEPRPSTTTAPPEAAYREVSNGPVRLGAASAAAPQAPEAASGQSRPRDPLGAPPDFGPGEVGVSARAVAPRPVEPLPLAPVFPERALTLRVGSAATVSPYGMLKTSAVYDTNLSSGDDFPFFGRVVAAGPETSNTTGTLVRPPDFRVKARSARLGVDVSAPDPHQRFTLTGKLEFDFEGDFPAATNRNIAALRSSQASIRFAWLRLDTRLGGVPFFLKFGQDASLFASSTQPTGLETTGNYIWQGNANQRAPGLVTGVRFDFGGGWDARLEPDFGIFLPSGGEYVAEVTGSPRWGSGLGSTFTLNNPAPGQGTVGFGQREGTNSGRPRYEARIVLEFDPWRGRGVAPSQIIASFQHGERVRYFQPPFQTAGRSFALRSDSNGYTGEFRLATPWWTLLGKYYRGADLRYYFGGLAQDVFIDGPDPFTTASVVPAMRPVRGQGGFAQLQLPLSVWFNPRNPRLHGFSANLMAGYDSAFARDARRSGQRRAQGALMGNILYQYNRYLTFGLETDFIQTYYTGEQGGLAPAEGAEAPGLRGRVGKNLRFEFGTIFSF